MTSRRGVLDTFHDPDELRKRRMRRGLSQKDLAAQVGISGAHMCDIENGKANGSAPVLKRIADALDCEISDFERQQPEARSA